MGDSHGGTKLPQIDLLAHVSGAQKQEPPEGIQLMHPQHLMQIAHQISGIYQMSRQQGLLTQAFTGCLLPFFLEWS